MKRMLFCGVFGSKRPKMRFFKFYEKSAPEITASLSLKVDIDDFLEKSCFEVFWAPREIVCDFFA